MSYFPPPDRRSTIARLALPIVGGMVSQNVLNLIDTAMVGTLGDEALAAVGLSSMVNFLSTAFITGLSVGVQAVAARRFGQGLTSETAVPLNGGLVLAATLGIPLSVVLIALTPYILPLVTPSADVVDIGTPYLQARYVAIVALGCNFSFRGYWNGCNRSALYMRTLVVMHVTNVVLNYLLIYGKLGAPALGATGAGIASATATFVGTGYYVWLGVRYARPAGFLRGLPDRASMVTMLRLSVPSGVQQTAYAAGLVVLFGILSRIGTSTTAAANVLINISLVSILPAIGLGIASASLVGQALGRKDADDARRWAWDVSHICVALLMAIGLPMVLAPDLLLSAFIHEDVTLDLARPALMLMGATLWLDGVGIVLMQSLMGAGATRTTMAVSVSLQWGIMLPMAYLVGLRMNVGLVGVWAVMAGQRLLQSVIYASLWKRGAWAHIEV